MGGQHFCLLFLIQLIRLIVCQGPEIRDCFFIDYNPYNIQLVCGDSVQKDSCFSSNFGHRSYTYVRLLKTGNCKGIRLTKTLPDTFQNLQTFDISFHGIDAITSDDLKFPNLRIFNASYNELSKLHGSIFFNTPQIFEADFSFNKITEISADGLKGATKLLKINLSHNQILNLNSETFVGLNELIKLDFSYNLIQSIERDTFHSNHKLEILHFENNPMKRIDCNIFYQFISSITMYVSWANVDQFDANCMRGRSSLEIEFTNDKVNFRAIHRNSYIYPMPVVMDIKGYFPNIRQFNISANRIQSAGDVIAKLGTTIETLDASGNFFTKNLLNDEIFRKLHSLKFLDLSYTQVSSLNYDTFSSLSELMTLDLSGNSIKSFDEHLFRNNSKLKVLHLKNNPLTRIDCSILWPLKNAVSVDLTWNAVEEVDTSCLMDLLQIDLNDQVFFRVIGSNSYINCTKTQFNALKSIRLAGNQLGNTQKVIDELGSTIETLDVASNFVGELNAMTFEKLNNLHHLNLSNTQLSNFGFSTFYHQNKLKSLDISFNHLKFSDFKLLFRNFKDLETLNLEGNDLTNIDTVTRSHFPKLSSLGISKNNFSCTYLAKFLLPWQNLQLFHNPSNQTHIDGVDCVHDVKIETMNSTTEQDNFVKMSSSTKIAHNTKSNLDIESTANKLNLVNANSADHSSDHILEELRALKYLIIIVCCGYLIVKCRLFQRIKRRIAENSTENAVVYRQNQNDFFSMIVK